MPRPTQGDKLVGPYAKPKVRGSGWAYQPGTLQLSQDEFIPLDSPAWLAWLDQQLAFRFEQVYYVAGLGLAEPVYLSYTVRPERRQRGQGYWYAYKKYHNQRLPGTYLGQTESLTLANLDRLALHFLALINPVFFDQVCQVGLVRFGKVPQPDLDPQP
ncbi:MAG: hypothetical protein KJZ77_19150 [Anaerolineales bacterium]|nr:hypothetical protein [Anaerolineales bacterium]